MTLIEYIAKLQVFRDTHENAGNLPVCIETDYRPQEIGPLPPSIIEECRYYPASGGQAEIGSIVLL